MTLKRNRLTVNGAALLALLATGTAQGAALAVPHSFSAGTPAVAAEVNANFDAVQTTINDNFTRIAALESALAALQTTVSAQATTISNQATAITNLESQITAQATTITNLQSQISAVNASNVMALESYLTVDTLSDSRGPLVQLAGVNLQVINGQGSTETANGLGNLIIGYDEADASGTGHCTIGWYSGGGVPTDSTNCATAGGTWTTSGFKSGSHFLVTGSQNNYSRWGGLLAGFRNTASYDYASVSGGTANTASGIRASVSGGLFNTASWAHASISGGYRNTAGAETASVSGGGYNTASGYGASVSGGVSNTASGSVSSVAGGGNGTMAGGNTAATSYSAILGGTGLTTTSNSQTMPALP
jgi:uncharacterized coiled-coil protein SlyX